MEIPPERKKRKAFYGATKTQCRNKAKAAQSAAEGVVDTAGLSVERWMETWLAWQRQLQRLKPRTLDFYEANARRHIIPTIGNLSLEALTPLRVQSWLDQLLQRGIGVPTVRHVRATLRVALGRALQLNLVSVNAAGAAIELPALRPEPAAALEPSECRPFQAAIFRQLSEGRTDFELAEATLLYVGLTTGLRNEEIAGLTWENLDLTPGACTLTVNRTLQRVSDTAGARVVHTNGREIQKKRWYVGPPKSAAGKRTLSLTPEAREMLAGEHARQQAAGWGVLDVGDLVFRTRFGTPLTDVYLNERMKRMCEKAGIRYRSFYALRHTVASLLHLAGESDVSIAQYLGHADPMTTKRRYTKVFEETKVPRMEKLRDVLRVISGLELDLAGDQGRVAGGTNRNGVRIELLQAGFGL
jgi:integrase